MEQVYGKCRCGVVGAGPVGLLTAIELTLGGARVVVLERLATPSLTIKALGVGAPGSEALQRRGMGAPLDAAEDRNLDVMAEAGLDMRGRMSKVGGHFAGLFLLRPDNQKDPHRRMRFVNQQGLEAVLGARAQALGIEVRRARDVTGFAQQPAGVDVDWASPTGKGRIRCAYLVGCDGGRSSVRKTAGFDFPGTPPTMTMYQAMVDVDHPERLASGGWRHTSEGTYGYGPFPRRLFMLDFSGPPKDREAPVTAEEMERVVRRISGADVRINAIEVANRWTDNTRLVGTYRKGRVLLAGDAAHIHSPFGGQGLSLGLADAANLGWKLAAIVRGEMPDSLLDSYTQERCPVAEAVLANTLAQAAIMRPDPQSNAMRDLMARLLKLDDVNQLVGERMRGVATRYDLGSERDDVGRLIADRPLGEGRTLYGLMQDGSGLLLDASSEAKASELVAAATPRVRCTQVASGPSMLIRPDGCVAWASEDEGTDGLEDALRRWFRHSL